MGKVARHSKQCISHIWRGKEVLEEDGGEENSYRERKTDGKRGKRRENDKDSVIEGGRGRAIHQEREGGR